MINALIDFFKKDIDILKTMSSIVKSPEVYRDCQNEIMSFEQSVKVQIVNALKVECKSAEMKILYSSILNSICTNITSDLVLCGYAFCRVIIKGSVISLDYLSAFDALQMTPEEILKENWAVVYFFSNDYGSNYNQICKSHAVRCLDTLYPHLITARKAEQANPSYTKDLHDICISQEMLNMHWEVYLGGLYKIQQEIAEYIKKHEH